MKVNIFGVGRSGTKAVQLFVSLLLLEKHDKISLNYEPYFWKSRKGQFSFRGIHHHVKSKLFLGEHDKLSSRHKSFLKRLVSQKHDYPIVSKFIRACGRIDKVNHHTRPNLSIVVIRDIFEVLDSVERQSWNLFQIGSPIIENFSYDFSLKMYDYLKKIKESGMDCVVDDSMCFDSTTMKNALFWYLSNWHMLNSSSNYILASYGNWTSLEEKLKVELDQQDSTISFSQLIGSDIRKDHVIQDTSERNQSTLTMAWNRNIFNYATKKRWISPWYLNEKQSNLVLRSERRIKSSTPKLKKNNNLIISNHDQTILHIMNDHINYLISKKTA